MEQRMERRLDTWLETGRQLVDGVSGRRPGQRRTCLLYTSDAADDSWPEDESFRVQRWQRTAGLDGQLDEQPVRQPMSSPRRVLPRSSRRRD